MSLVNCEIDDGVAVVTLNDPKRRNALSTALADALHATFSSLGSSDEVRAAVITGAPPAFSAGADLNDLENATPENLHRIYDGFLSVSSPSPAFLSSPSRRSTAPPSAPASISPSPATSV